MSPKHKDTTSELVVPQHTRDDSSKVSSITFGVNGSAQRFPKALVIGVRKAGTHALITYLSLHPDIAATTSEVHYFDGNYDRGTEWYRHQMYSQPYQLTMESSPKYFHDPKVPSRIREFNSSMALVLVVRDPVLRAVSDYTHRVARHFRDEHRSFERMVLTKSGKVATKYKPVWVSEYINYFSRYLRVIYPGSAACCWRGQVGERSCGGAGTPTRFSRFTEKNNQWQCLLQWNQKFLLYALLKRNKLLFAVWQRTTPSVRQTSHSG